MVGVAVEVAIRYEPRPPQAAFHADRYKVVHRAAFAGTGGGKTLAGAGEMLAWMLENPGCKVLAAEPDVPMVKRVMLPALESPLLLGMSNRDWERHPLVESWNRTDLHLTLKNRSEGWFVGLKEEGKLEGPNVDVGWMDEGRVVRDWANKWRAFTRRIRGSRPGARTGTWITTHSPTADQVAWFEGPNKDPNARVYRWSTLDMRDVLGDRYVDEIVRNHSGSAYQAVVLGLHARAEGLVYDVRPDRNVAPWPTEPHGAALAHDRVSGGVDWGDTVPSALVVAKWVGERAWLVDESYGAHRDVADLLAEAVRLEDEHGRMTWWCGPDRPEHIRYFRQGDPARGLRGVDARAYIGKVVDGIGVMNRKLRAAELMVTPRCEAFLREAELCQWKTGGSKEEPEKGNDHALDAARYNVCGTLQGATPHATVVRPATKRVRTPRPDHKRMG